MGRISKALRFEILARDGFRCRYCGATAAMGALQLDHVLPRALGGRDDAANLVTACQPCNAGKSDRKIIAAPDGFALTPDKRPARMAKMQRARKQAESSQEVHELDCYNIDELDEINGDNQLCWVWCETHRKYEWHSIDRAYAQRGGHITMRRKPVTW